MLRVLVVNSARVPGIDLAAQQKLNDFAAAAGGDDLGLDAALLDETVDERLRDAADMGQADARIALRVRRQFLERRIEETIARLDSINIGFNEISNNIRIFNIL